MLATLPQKRNGTSLAQDGEKRARLDQLGEYFIEQRLVGWIIGKGGATLREIEQAHGVKVTLDQSSKSSGFSKVQISGLEAKIQEAVDHINISLSSAGSAADGSIPCLLEQVPSAGSQELQVKQRFVGWLLGKAGAAISDIEKASGCQILVNQETKGLGYSTVQLVGSEAQIAEARQSIEASIERAKAAREGQMAEETVEIEQRWVGWLLGKKGGLVQVIEQETGAHVRIDQSTSTLGYSTVVLTGTADQVDSARDRVNASLEKAGAAPMAAKAAAAVRAQSVVPDGLSGGSRGSNVSTQVTVEQQWVGWLLGKNGVAVKEIEANTGAKIAVNQDTKAQGYSTISLSGTPFQVQAAYDTMTESLRRAGGALSELPQSSFGRRHEKGLIDAVRRLASTLVEHAGQDALWRIFPSLQESLAGHLDVVESLRSLVPLRSNSIQSSHLNQLGGPGAHTMDIQVEQKMVGWLLGGRGKTVQQIEEESGAKINIDQSTKDAGYSIVHVYGSMSAVQQAERRIQASIGIVSKDSQGPGHTQDESSDMDIEQRLVGWILGKSGMVLKQIQLQSGAFVTIDQSTKELGFSKVKITGSFTSRQAAKRLIEEKLVEADISALGR